MAYICTPDGTRTPIDIPISLEKAREVIGGYVERVCPKHTPSVVFLCDEDGLSKQLPHNPHGQELYGPYSPVVGTIIVMSRAEASGWQ